MRLPPAALAAGALVLAAVAVVLPWAALPALVVVLLVAIVSRGRARLVTGVVGGLLVAVAAVRFTLIVAVPNIIHAGLLSAEDKALSRLREIQWAESMRKQLHGRYAPLEVLVAPAPGDGEAILAPDRFAPATGTSAWRSEGFLFVVHPRSDGQSFVAYAWPVDRRRNGARAFALDEQDHICERGGRPGESAPAGAAETPSADAAMTAQQPCGTGSDGNLWRAWRGKKSRTAEAR